uniref:Uncharacterized protein n=1 Tax=Rhizophora mucronata TaxID=61149 RepID=A0A2P2PQ81_RHIMU
MFARQSLNKCVDADKFAFCPLIVG